ncbi:MAG: diphosphomevalonate decarboxylase [Osedax symbiont Rs1]|nr:MAG: diphosphomevalonate decarboxylase [Osedax symbiont Rs1]
MDLNTALPVIDKASVVGAYLKPVLDAKDRAEAFAPSNIALCKYWGKRDLELNLPVNSSLSISLAHLGSRTTISHSTSGVDQVKLNNKVLPLDSVFSGKVLAFVKLFRRQQQVPLLIDTHNNIPTAAGLASSASGFAALMLALDDFFNLHLDKQVLSAFARMGSGSASRSIFSGFVRWDMGSAADGMDSCAVALSQQWHTLRIGLIKVASSQKPVDSSSGMNRTIASSKLYSSWPEQAAEDLFTIENAIDSQDFDALGCCAEQNAMSMHATMLSAWPPLVYWLPESLAVMQQVWRLRAAGIAVYFTMDAGPNLKLLFEAESQKVLEAEFPMMDVIAPFSV